MARLMSLGAVRRSVTALVVMGCGIVAQGARALEGGSGQEQALAEIRRRGGRVTQELASPDRPVVAVSFRRVIGSPPAGDGELLPLTDADLVHLRALTGLRTLDLGSNEITDAGLTHLEGLIRLEALNLSGTRITDAGLTHLEGLTRLEALDLTGTRVTGAGLVHLKGLANLQELDLDETRVTATGLAWIPTQGKPANESA
jgi:Leucine rich repeat